MACLGISAQDAPFRLGAGIRQDTYKRLLCA